MSRTAARIWLNRSKITRIFGVTLAEPFVVDIPGWHEATYDADTGKATIKRATEELTANRWAAFNDDELGVLEGWYWRAEAEYGPLEDADESLRAEIKVELERRKA